MEPLKTILLLTGNLALKHINARTEQPHLLSKLTPSECKVRPLLDIECSPQHQAKSNFFFFPAEFECSLEEIFIIIIIIYSFIHFQALIWG